MREKEAEFLRDKCSPSGRNTLAGTSEPAAMPRRSEIDHSGGLEKPRGVPCEHGAHVAAAAATPAGDDTLSLRFLSDRRGASAGVAPHIRGAATWLRHHAPCGVSAAERCHAASEGPAGDAELPSVVRCVRAGGTRTTAHRSSDGRIALSHSSAVRLSG